MKTSFFAVAVGLALTGCSTLNDLGIGGEPLIFCRKGQAVIDDKIVGSEASRVTVLRRIKDADAVCRGNP